MMSSWYLLKNRRYLGPYTRAELEQLKASGKVDSSDMLSTPEDVKSGQANFRPISEIISFRPLPPRLSSQNSATPNLPSASLTNEHPADENYEPPLGSFSDEDLMNNEVSRVFTQLVDSVDLAKGQHTQTGFASSRRGPAQNSTDRSGAFAEENATSRITSFSSDGEGSPWFHVKSFLASQVGVMSILLLFVGLGAYYFMNNGSLDKVFPKSRETSKVSHAKGRNPQAPTFTNEARSPSSNRAPDRPALRMPIQRPRPSMAPPVAHVPEPTPPSEEIRQPASEDTARPAKFKIPKRKRALNPVDSPRASENNEGVDEDVEADVEGQEDGAGSESDQGY